MAGNVPLNTSRTMGVEEKAGIGFIPNVGSQRKKLDASVSEKKIRLREIHHRIKNDMAAISSYLSIQADELPERSRGRTALLEARSRVDGMMRLYDRLSESEDFRTVSAKEYLGDLVHDLGCLIPEPDRVHVLSECDDIPMDSRVLFPLGMAINELVVNAVKHAFQNGGCGVVRVKLCRDSQGAVVAAVEDTGSGFSPSAEPSSGFGLSLVDALIEQIGGTLETTSVLGRGSAFRIRIPKG